MSYTNIILVMYRDYARTLSCRATQALSYLQSLVFMAYAGKQFQSGCIVVSHQKFVER